MKGYVENLHIKMLYEAECSTSLSSLRVYRV